MSIDRLQKYERRKVLGRMHELIRSVRRETEEKGQRKGDLEASRKAMTSSSAELSWIELESSGETSVHTSLMSTFTANPPMLIDLDTSSILMSTKDKQTSVRYQGWPSDSRRLDREGERTRMNADPLDAPNETGVWHRMADLTTTLVQLIDLEMSEVGNSCRRIYFVRSARMALNALEERRRQYDHGGRRAHRRAQWISLRELRKTVGLSRSFADFIVSKIKRFKIPGPSSLGRS